MRPADRILRARLQQLLRFPPGNLDLYRMALTHRSAVGHRGAGACGNNERLEYLGDSILDAIVANHLFVQFPKQGEGFLTKMRSRIVCRAHLNAVGLALGLDGLVTLNTSSPDAPKHILGDALEALVGAIYLDKGFAHASRWVERHLLRPHANLNELLATESDYKSRIIEWAQKHKLPIRFECAEQDEGRGKNPSYQCSLYLRQQLLGTGYGPSKKEAEQNAAMVALERIDIIALPQERMVSSGTCFQN